MSHNITFARNVYRKDESVSSNLRNDSPDYATNYYSLECIIEAQEGDGRKGILGTLILSIIVVSPLVVYGIKMACNFIRNFEYSGFGDLLLSIFLAAISLGMLCATITLLYSVSSMASMVVLMIYYSIQDKIKISKNNKVKELMGKGFYIVHPFSLRILNRKYSSKRKKIGLIFSKEADQIFNECTEYSLLGKRRIYIH